MSEKSRSGKTKRSIIQQFKIIIVLTFFLLVLGLAAVIAIAWRISENLSYQYLRNSSDSFATELQNTYLTASNISALFTLQDPFVRYICSEDPSAGSALNEMASEIVFLRSVNASITDISVIGDGFLHPVMLKKDSLAALEASLNEEERAGIACVISETPMYGRNPYTARLLSYVLNVYKKEERRGAVVVSFSPESIISSATSMATFSADYVFLDSAGVPLDLGSGGRFSLLTEAGQRHALSHARENSAPSLLFPLKERLKKGSYLIDIQYLPRLDGYLVSGIDSRQLFSQYNNLWILFTVSFLIVAAFFVYITASFYRSFVLPLRRLSANLYASQQGGYAHPVFKEIPGCLELSQINRDFFETQQATYALNRRIFDTQQQLYEQDRQQKLTELAMFRSQVNPHFLANALELVSSCGDQVHDSRVREISSAISRIYRYSAHITEPATIQDELGIINDYMYIQTLRYGPSLSFITFFPEDTKGLATIRMLLQPLVENCISHGFTNKNYSGTIYVGAHIEDGLLVIDVRDDGDGIAPDELDELNRSLEEPLADYPGHIGLHNTNSRIKLIFGEDYGVTVLSEPGNGTVVRIRFPAVNSLPEH